jgi:hypothetical protein
MRTSPEQTPHQSPTLAVELARLRTEVERDFGFSITPVEAKSLFLTGKDQKDFTAAIEAQGVRFVEIKPGKVDLGYLARRPDFADCTATVEGCSDPAGVESHAGQRFVLHGTSALGLNLLAGRWGISTRVPSEDRRSVADVAFFTARTAKLDEDADISRYARKIGDYFGGADIHLDGRAAELAQIPLVLAIDVRGYALLSNRPQADQKRTNFFICDKNWAFIAVCPPPKEFIHVLGILPPEEGQCFPGKFRDIGRQQNKADPIA